MNDAQSLAAFEAHRTLLFGIAYRMLGTAADAEDILQEAQLKWLRTDTPVDSVRAFLVTIVSRLCLDHLDSARVRRETYVGPWLPEPIVTAPDADPEHLSMAFLLLLERLSPAERAAFLLADVFDYRFSEVAALLDKSEEACRQLAARARRAVQHDKKRPVDRAEHERVLGAFMGAVASGDLAGLVKLLADDAVAVSDGGGRVRAALNVIEGADRVARLMLGLAKKTAVAEVELCTLNGLPALRLRADGAVFSVMCLEVDDGRVRSVFLVNNPDKLRHVDA